MASFSFTRAWLETSGGGDRGVFPVRVEDLAAVELEREEKELSASVRKLKSSIQEMKEFDPEGKDEDLVQAQVENMGVIKRQEQRLASVRDRLREIRGPES